MPKETLEVYSDDDGKWWIGSLGLPTGHTLTNNPPSTLLSIGRRSWARRAMGRQ